MLRHSTSKRPSKATSYKIQRNTAGGENHHMCALCPSGPHNPHPKDWIGKHRDTSCHGKRTSGASCHRQVYPCHQAACRLPLSTETPRRWTACHIWGITVRMVLKRSSVHTKRTFVATSDADSAHRGHLQAHPGTRDCRTPLQFRDQGSGHLLYGLELRYDIRYWLNICRSRAIATEKNRKPRIRRTARRNTLKNRFFRPQKPYKTFYAAVWRGCKT